MYSLPNTFIASEIHCHSEVGGMIHTHLPLICMAINVFIAKYIHCQWDSLSPRGGWRDPYTLASLFEWQSRLIWVAIQSYLSGKKCIHCQWDSLPPRGGWRDPYSLMAFLQPNSSLARDFSNLLEMAKICAKLGSSDKNAICRFFSIQNG